MAATDAIDRLRGIATRLEVREDPDAEWFREALALYESGARHGLDLDAALGLRPGPGGTTWWEQEAAAQRDDLVRLIAARYFGGLSQRAQAEAITHKVRGYEAGAYRAHRKFAAAPRAILGSVRAWLFALLKTGAPISVSTVRRALAQETPLFVSHASGDDPPEDREDVA